MLQLHKMLEVSECEVSMRVEANEYVKYYNEAEEYKEIPKNRRMGSNTRFLANPREIVRNARKCTM